VILVANDVPAPSDITDAWLTEHDWILRRVILDDSFRPALDYLSKSFVGAEINIRILEDNAAAQKNLVNTLTQQLQTQGAVIGAGELAIKNAVEAAISAGQSNSILNAIKGIFDPAGITGQTDLGAATAAQTRLDYLKDQLDRAEKERRRLQSQLDIANTALQAAVDKLGAAVKEHYDNLTAIDRLRVHVKENILYYMQAKWTHEPPDQRYFRLYDKEVADLVAVMHGVEVDLSSASALPWTPSGTNGYLNAQLPMPDVGVVMKKLADVADLDKILGFKGNYMIFPLIKNNYLTFHMMQDYLEVSDEVTLRDPDELGDYTLDEIEQIASCMRKTDPKGFKIVEGELKQAIMDRLMTHQETDTVVVPTSSVYIEALVGAHVLLEDFKLIHRALDIKKVQAEVRHAELENIRLASRALKGKDEDPDVEKKIVIESSGKHVTIAPGDN